MIFTLRFFYVIFIFIAFTKFYKSRDLMLDSMIIISNIILKFVLNEFIDGWTVFHRIIGGSYIGITR